ncbi:MAG: hypothetical protein WCO45_09605 [Pseudanabaena sp. ELA607]
MSDLNDLSIESQQYMAENLAYHLIQAGMVDELCEILTEFDFLDFKSSMTQSQSIIDDFELALSSGLKIEDDMKKTFELIESAVRLSANVIDTDKQQFIQQLWGRLISYKFPEIQKILDSLKQKDTIWLRSLAPSFTQAGGSLLRTLTINNGYANSILITPDGYIIGGLSDGNIKIWELSSGAEQRIFSSHSGAVNSVKLTTNSKNLISGSADQTVRVWDFKTGNLIFALIGHNASVNAVAITPDDKWVISGSDDGNIKIWDLQTGKENIFGKLLFSLANSTNSINTLVIHPDYTKGKKLVISGSNDQTIRVYNIESNGELDYEIFQLKDHNNNISSIVCSPDGQLIISGSLDKTIGVWNFERRKKILTLAGHTEDINAVAISVDSKLVISGSSDKTIKVFNLETGKEVTSLAGHTDKVTAVVISPNGKQIISSSVDETLKIWDLEKNINVLKPEVEEKNNTSLSHNNSLEAIIITPDGKQGISASVDGIIKIWNLEKIQEILTLKSQNASIKKLIVTPNSEYLISVFANNLAIVWDLKLGKELLTLSIYGDSNHGFAITPDSKYLIVISSEKTLEIWNLGSQRLITKFSGDSSLNCCTVAPDGLTIMAGEASGQLHFLQLEGID